MKLLYSENSRKEMEKSFQKASLQVQEWVSIDLKDQRGHYVLQENIYSINSYLNETKAPDFKLE